jgi:hypothetical protein
MTISKDERHTAHCSVETLRLHVSCHNGQTVCFVKTASTPAGFCQLDFEKGTSSVEQPTQSLRMPPVEQQEVHKGFVTSLVNPARIDPIG